MCKGLEVQVSENPSSRTLKRWEHSCGCVGMSGHVEQEKGVRQTAAQEESSGCVSLVSDTPGSTEEEAWVWGGCRQHCPPEARQEAW